MVSPHLLVLALLVSSLPRIAQADTYVVTNTSSGTGAGTLALAIQSATYHAGTDSIHFNIPGGGVHSFVASFSDGIALPHDTVLDGYTQPGSSPNTAKVGQPSNAVIKIQIVAGDVCSDDYWYYYPGLEVGRRSVVRGIRIDRGFCNCIIVHGDDNVIEGSHVSGATYGILILGMRNRIGGTTPASRNIIVGNLEAGIAVSGSIQFPAIDNVIVGNYIGIDAALGQAGNHYGIMVSYYSTGTRIGGHATDPCEVPAAANIINYNTKDGVAITGSQANGTTILSNLMHSNGGIGIDIGDDGVTPNDELDGDEGLNTLQNHPRILEIYANDVSGILESRPGEAYTIQVFDNSSCDPSGVGEGKILHGETQVATDQSGVGYFHIQCAAVQPGRYYTATATDSEGNTSEFSPCYQAPVTAVRDGPGMFQLHVNVPNPFNPSTTIPFEMGEAGHVEIAIFDTSGRRVRTLIAGTRPAGSGSATWDGRDEAGRSASSGVYFCRMRADGFQVTRKIMLLK